MTAQSDAAKVMQDTASIINGTTGVLRTGIDATRLVANTAAKTMAQAQAQKNPFLAAMAAVEGVVALNAGIVMFNAIAAGGITGAQVGAYGAMAAFAIDFVEGAASVPSDGHVNPPGPPARRG